MPIVQMNQPTQKYMYNAQVIEDGSEVYIYYFYYYYMDTG